MTKHLLGHHQQKDPSIEQVFPVYCEAILNEFFDLFLLAHFQLYIVCLRSINIWSSIRTYDPVRREQSADYPISREIFSAHTLHLFGPFI